MATIEDIADPENQSLILLAEIGVLIHDLGKLSREFVESHSEGVKSNGWSHNDVIKSHRLCEVPLHIKPILEEEDGPQQAIIIAIQSELQRKGWNKSDAESIANICQRRITNNQISVIKGQLLPDPRRYAGFSDEQNIELTEVIKAILDPVLWHEKRLKNEALISDGFIPPELKYQLNEMSLQFKDEKTFLKDFIEMHHDDHWKIPLLVQLLKAGEDGGGVDGLDSLMDKGVIGDKFNKFKQRLEKSFAATAFGFEDEDRRLAMNPVEDHMKNARHKFSEVLARELSKVREGKSTLALVRLSIFAASEIAFRKALGETRRASNDVTLWDHSYSVAGLYKAALVKVMIEGWVQPKDIKWRFIRVGVSGLMFYALAHRVTDMLGRRQALQEALDMVRQALEVKLPLGNEVYRDENGSIFVVPGLSDKAEYQKLTLKIEKLVQEAFREGGLEGELVPHVDWNDGGPVRKKMINSFGNLVVHELHPLTTDARKIRDWWSNPQSRNKEICTVCGVRPQGPSEKATERDVCDVCEGRRIERSKDWATKKLNTTIWIDEVADKTDRLALIVGSFELDHWLKGDLIRTLTVRDPGNARKEKVAEVSKNASFARLRRIWETTHIFWQEICPTIQDDARENIANEERTLDNSLVGKKFKQIIEMPYRRFGIRGIIKSSRPGMTLGAYHAYDLVFPKGKISAVWDPEIERLELERSKRGRFITADNLARLKERLGRRVEDILEELMEEESPLVIEESIGYGSKTKVWGSIVLDSKIEDISENYTPVIPVLAEPRTFMCLVPADKALEIIEIIKIKYEREMGKVRNRLPLQLGIVYAHRRMPLRAILDAGRRMMDQTSKPEGWKVICVARKLADRDNLPERFEVDKGGQFHEWFEVLLTKEGHRLTWYAPATMGDCTILDEWYPYVFLCSSSEPLDRPSRFKSVNPWTKAPGWLIHINDLKGDDLVYFTPATLEYQWLDSAGRRFEINYYDDGQRHGLLRRPYLLDELDSLGEIWKALKYHLSKNQIYILRDLIEDKRLEWSVSMPKLVEDDVFWHFCYDTMANAGWTKAKKSEQSEEDGRCGKMPWEAEGKDRKDWLAQWANYAAKGWIADVVELYLDIMKEEVRDEF